MSAVKSDFFRAMEYICNHDYGNDEDKVVKALLLAVVELVMKGWASETKMENEIRVLREEGVRMGYESQLAENNNLFYKGKIEMLSGRYAEVTAELVNLRAAIEKQKPEYGITPVKQMKASSSVYCFDITNSDSGSLASTRATECVPPLIDFDCNEESQFIPIPPAALDNRRIITARRKLMVD
jgi:hypothetical protein